MMSGVECNGIYMCSLKFVEVYGMNVNKKFIGFR